MFTTAVVFAVLAVLTLIASVLFKVQKPGAYDRQTGITGPSTVDKRPNHYTRVGAGGLIGLSILFAILGSFFTQDVGQSSVLRDWTGNIVGQEPASGFHWKAPWVDVVTFDIRNQRVVYAGKTGEQSDNSGGTADGAQITVQDKEGVSSNIDIAIRYSIKPDSVIDIYSQYKTEENLQTRLIFNDIRSVVRSVPGKFTTLALLTDRDAVQSAIREALEAKWEKEGIIVDDVALQEIRPPEAVRDSYAAAQQAQIDVSKEQANLEAATVSAQQKVVQAQAEADANALLASSLTPAILQQRYLDTLKELAKAGNLVVVPEGFNGLVNVSK